eukprot:TRINITY_DN664_c0_g6_i1.p1 TRINITY_DN664_c0_g6~~TRINITY_DN664_c0_g6_i1.p1  ORF type:complete len:2059 (-),score=538.36 TRINITY_DN664_c0_g6_i1:94-5751(-)
MMGKRSSQLLRIFNGAADWTCSQCFNKNTSFRNYCNRCGEAAPLISDRVNRNNTPTRRSEGRRKSESRPAVYPLFKDYEKEKRYYNHFPEKFLLLLLKHFENWEMLYAGLAKSEESNEKGNESRSRINFQPNHGGTLFSWAFWKEDVEHFRSDLLMHMFCHICMLPVTSSTVSIIKRGVNFCSGMIWNLKRDSNGTTINIFMQMLFSRMSIILASAVGAMVEVDKTVNKDFHIFQIWCNKLAVILDVLRTLEEMSKDLSIELKDHYEVKCLVMKNMLNLTVAFTTSRFANKPSLLAKEQMNSDEYNFSSRIGNVLLEKMFSIWIHCATNLNSEQSEKEGELWEEMKNSLVTVFHYPDVFGYFHKTILMITEVLKLTILLEAKQKLSKGSDHPERNVYWVNGHLNNEDKHLTWSVRSAALVWHHLLTILSAALDIKTPEPAASNFVENEKESELSKQRKVNFKATSLSTTKMRCLSEVADTLVYRTSVWTTEKLKQERVEFDAPRNKENPRTVSPLILCDKRVVSVIKRLLKLLLKRCTPKHSLEDPANNTEQVLLAHSGTCDLVCAISECYNLSMKDNGNNNNYHHHHNNGGVSKGKSVPMTERDKLRFFEILFRGLQLPGGGQEEEGVFDNDMEGNINNDDDYYGANIDIMKEQLSEPEKSLGDSIVSGIQVGSSAGASPNIKLGSEINFLPSNEVSELNNSTKNIELDAWEQTKIMCLILEKTAGIFSWKGLTGPKEHYLKGCEVLIPTYVNAIQYLLMKDNAAWILSLVTFTDMIEVVINILGSLLFWCNWGMLEKKITLGSFLLGEKSLKLQRGVLNDELDFWRAVREVDMIDSEVLKGSLVYILTEGLDALASASFVAESTGRGGLLASDQPRPRKQGKIIKGNNITAVLGSLRWGARSGAVHKESQMSLLPLRDIDVEKMRNLRRSRHLLASVKYFIIEELGVLSRCKNVEDISEQTLETIWLMLSQLLKLTRDPTIGLALDAVAYLKHLISFSPILLRIIRKKSYHSNSGSGNSNSGSTPKDVNLNLLRTSNNIDNLSYNINGECKYLFIENYEGGVYNAVSLIFDDVVCTLIDKHKSKKLDKSDEMIQIELLFTLREWMMVPIRIDNKDSLLLYDDFIGGKMTTVLQTFLIGSYNLFISKLTTDYADQKLGDDVSSIGWKQRWNMHDNNLRSSKNNYYDSLYDLYSKYRRSGNNNASKSNEDLAEEFVSDSNGSNSSANKNEGVNIKKDQIIRNSPIEMASVAAAVTSRNVVVADCAEELLLFVLHIYSSHRDNPDLKRVYGEELNCTRNMEAETAQIFYCESENTLFTVCNRRMNKNHVKKTIIARNAIGKWMWESEQEQEEEDEEDEEDEENREGVYVNNIPAPKYNGYYRNMLMSNVTPVPEEKKLLRLKLDPNTISHILYDLDEKHPYQHHITVGLRYVSVDNTTVNTWNWIKDRLGSKSNHHNREWESVSKMYKITYIEENKNKNKTKEDDNEEEETIMEEEENMDVKIVWSENVFRTKHEEWKDKDSPMFAPFLFSSFNQHNKNNHNTNNDSIQVVIVLYPISTNSTNSNPNPDSDLVKVEVIWRRKQSLKTSGNNSNNSLSIGSGGNNSFASFYTPPSTPRTTPRSSTRKKEVNSNTNNNNSSNFPSEERMVFGSLDLTRHSSNENTPRNNIHFSNNGINNNGNNSNYKDTINNNSNKDCPVSMATWRSSFLVGPLTTFLIVRVSQVPEMIKETSVGIWQIMKRSSGKKRRRGGFIVNERELWNKREEVIRDWVAENRKKEEREEERDLNLEKEFGSGSFAEKFGGGSFAEKFGSGNYGTSSGSEESGAIGNGNLGTEKKEKKGEGVVAWLKNEVSKGEGTVGKVKQGVGRGVRRKQKSGGGNVIVNVDG